ncbi:MAG: RnfABCDGE type electron transport complex subunit C [Eubacteriales bacterium]|mgnify:FL=1|nr:RnfABCDGE type electron transport complex subunit C [Eubacteriales bacterium]MDD4422509.1 RnfABCDGE type electron transport complex subunit C [Eubacteriales bacterium]
MPLTFFGGIKPENKKYSRDYPLRYVTPPELVYIPIDGYVSPLVEAGGTVAMGQAVAVRDDGMQLYSSVSGIVKGTAKEGEHRYIAIENDKKDTPFEGIKGIKKPLLELSADEICALLKQYSVIDCFDEKPMYIKLSEHKGNLKRIIINCCEHDVYTTALYRLLLERPKELINGAKILMHALSIKKCVILIEDKKRKAIQVLEDYVNDTRMFVPAFIENKYPINEQTIISAVYSREIPHGKTATDLGYVIFGAEAVMQTFISFATGMPQIRKAVTVSGESVKKPQNLIAPIGTPLKNLIEECGGLVHRCRCVVLGGIMDGEFLENPGGVVTQTTRQLLLLRWVEKYNGTRMRCVRCGRCISVCPMHLIPLDYAVEDSLKKKSQKPFYGIEACIECGCCEYICPAGIPLLEIIREEKGKRLSGKKSDTETKKPHRKFISVKKTFIRNRKPKNKDDDESDFFIPF